MKSQITFEYLEAAYVAAFGPCKNKTDLNKFFNMAKNLGLGKPVVKKEKFTSGNWVVNPNPNASPIISVDGDKDWPIVKQVHGPTLKEAYENARVMALAPKLLSALEEMLSAFDIGQCKDGVGAVGRARKLVKEYRK